MNDFNHLEQLVACVARGRHSLPNKLDHVWLALGQDPFGDAELALDGFLEDPNVDEAIKVQIRELLATIDSPVVRGSAVD